MASPNKTLDTTRGQPAGPRGLLKAATKVLIGGLVASSFSVAALVFLSSALPILLGFKVMIVSSGSMQPAIGVGDAVLLRPAGGAASSAPTGPVRVGDVITFATTRASGIITHRVVAVREIQGQTYYQTKGDANATSDPDLTPADMVQGKVTLRLPKMGYLLYFAGGLWGKLFIALIPTLSLVVWEIVGLRQARKEREPDRQLQGLGSV